MRRLYLLITLAITLFFLSPLFTGAPVYAAVVINELLPKTEPVSGEWIELYNTGSESVSLDRWHLDHIAGDAKSYILNAGAVIGPHGFLTLDGSQTAIGFSVQGDTVRLFDASGTLVDSKTYPGTLGYNTTMGRSTDGGDGWVICSPDPYSATPDKPNSCPQPPTLTPTPTPTPVNTPTPTPRPLPTNTPMPTPAGQSPLGGATPTPAQQTFGSFLPSPTQTRVLGAAAIPSPTPTPDPTRITFTVDKIFTWQVLTVAIAWGAIAAIAYIRRK